MRKEIADSPSLSRRIIAFLLVFVLVLLGQAGLSQYQTRHVILPQQERTREIRVISQFLNNVEDCMRCLDNYRWDYGKPQELEDQVSKSQRENDGLLARLDIGVDTGSEEQYLLFSASSTTYGTFSKLLDEILEMLDQGQRDQAAELYYAKAKPCGAYTRQYTQQLLECSIRDSQSAYTELSRLSDKLGRLQVMLFTLCAIICVAMSASLFTLLFSVQQMAAASREISRGQLDIPDVDESREDEIGQMAKAFNEMKHSMRHQVQVLEEKNEMERALYKKQNEALELQNLMEQEKMQKLRSQINPHFLFNTLNVVLYTAQQEGAEQTQALIGSLGNLFRYTLASNTALAPLAREVRIVNEFYTLSKARFGDRINLKWEVSPEIDLTETLVPTFLIQPLVENAFRHGLGHKEAGGCVWVKMAVEGENLAVWVTDDGVGMDEATLETLQQNLMSPPDTGDHIGLYNVAARLRLLGEGYGLAITSRLGEGTQAALRLPLMTAEEREEEADA